MIQSIIENKNEIKFVIEPRKYRTDLKLLMFILLAWFFLTVSTIVGTFYTYSNNAFILSNAFPLFFLAIGYFSILYFPYLIYNKNRVQTLLIEGEFLIIIGSEILPKTKIQIKKEDLKSLTFIREIVDNEKVYNRTLQINYLLNDKPKYASLANLIHPIDQLAIFEEIRKFLNNNGFLVETKVELPMGND